MAKVLPQNYTTDHSDAFRQPQPAKERVKWPRMSSNKEWQQLGEDLDKILEVALARTVERKINAMTAITYNLAREWFGIEERKTTSLKEKQPNYQIILVSYLRRR